MSRAIDYGGILLFAVLAPWSLWRLAEASGPYFVPVLLGAAPLAWLAADLLSGLLHFAFDSWGSTRTPFIGPTFIRPFREHHVDPQAMTRHDFVETNGASCIACLPLLSATAAMPLDTAAWIGLQALALCVAAAALLTNQCHKWAHMEEGATPMLIRWAQGKGLVLEPEHHRRHHTPPFDSHFCMSNGWLNPLFNRLLRAAR